MRIFLFFLHLIRKITLLLRKPKEIGISKITGQRRFNGKNVLIIGGDSGLGFDIAANIIAEGGNVLITGRNKEKLINASVKLGDSCHYLVWDIAEKAAAERKFAEALSMMDNRINSIVYSAGVFINQDCLICGEREWDVSFAVNAEGFVTLYDCCIGALEKNAAGGNMLIINSIRGRVHDTTPYSITKAAINDAVGCFALKSEGKVRINAVAPGPTAGTDINKVNIHGDLSTNAYHCGRFLVPQEITEMAVFLLSDDAMGINGQVITCDSGESLL